MSNYGVGRRGGGQVNFSTFIQDLNVEVPSQETSPVGEKEWDQDLAMFTNTTFFDWDNATNGSDFAAATVQGPEVEKKSNAAVSLEPASATSAVGDFNFDIQDDFNFDYTGFATPTVPSFTDNLGGLQQLQPNQSAAFQAAQQDPYAVPQHAGVKRPSDAGHSRQFNLEDQSRLAAEEDKRRRNTAASARFRIKKKAREQALEKKEKELQDEVSQLKNRITHLETENKWLRGLVMEKTGSKESKFDPKLAAALKVLGKDSDSEEDDKRAKSEESEVEAK